MSKRIINIYLMKSIEMHALNYALYNECIELGNEKN